MQPYPSTTPGAGEPQKMKSFINRMQKLEGSIWGYDDQMLQMSTLALVYSMNEYCAPVWGRSLHTDLVDTHLNAAMRFITGTLKSMPLPWFSFLANIHPPTIQRKMAILCECTKAFTN